MQEGYQLLVLTGGLIAWWATAGSALYYGLEVALPRYLENRRSDRDMERRGYQIGYDFDKNGNIHLTKKPLD